MKIQKVSELGKNLNESLRKILADVNNGNPEQTSIPMGHTEEQQVKNFSFRVDSRERLQKAQAAVFSLLEKLHQEGDVNRINNAVDSIVNLCENIETENMDKALSIPE